MPPDVIACFIVPRLPPPAVKIKVYFVHFLQFVEYPQVLGKQRSVPVFFLFNSFRHSLRTCRNILWHATIADFREGSTHISPVGNKPYIHILSRRPDQMVCRQKILSLILKWPGDVTYMKVFGTFLIIKLYKVTLNKVFVTFISQ